MLNFKQWLAEDLMGKVPLYPLGYGGIGLYPVGMLLPGEADAITYLSDEERKYKGQDGPPFNILHLKHDYNNEGHPTYKLPPDTSKQYKTKMPPDTSVQPRRWLPN